MKPVNKAKLIVVLNTITLIGGAITVILLFRIISNAAAQNTQTNERIVQSQKVTEDELRCLASFFSQTNRQTIRISNLETCEILHTDTGQTEVLPLSPKATSTDNSPAVPPSDTNQNPTPNQTTTQQPANDTNTPTSQNSTQSQAAQQANDEVENIVKPPKELLGIPLCIPFTSQCMR